MLNDLYNFIETSMIFDQSNPLHWKCVQDDDELEIGRRILMKFDSTSKENGEEWKVNVVKKTTPMSKRAGKQIIF